MKIKTKEEQIEHCYKQVTYSRAFSAPIGYKSIPDLWKVSSLREAENRRNKFWKNKLNERNTCDS